MTNKFFSSVDGNHSRVASDLPSRCSRLASLSIVSRQSVLSILLLCLTLFLGVGNAWANYSLTFSTGSGDGTSSSTSTTASACLSGGSDYVTGNLATASNVYRAGSAGLKLGTSSGAGNIKMNLSNSGKVYAKKIIVSAKRYNSSKAATVNINGGTAQNVTADFANYSFTINGNITYVQIQSSKYIWVESVRVVDCDAPTAVTKGTITSNSVALTITDASNVGTYEVYYSTSSTAPNDGTTISTTVNTKTPTVTGLNASTTYYLWVRSKCSNTSKSDWCALTGSSFTTASAAPAKTLSSISVQTAPTKKKYVAGEMFDPTGLIITRTYSDATSDTYTYANHTGDFTFSPTTSTALTTSNTSVSITYGGKSTLQAINVYNVTMQARDEDGNAIPAGGPGAPSRTGKSITPAADANNYVFKQWQVTNASLGSGESTKSNTITNPTEAVTVTAVYYKPITITYKANGQDFTTQTYGYGGTLAFPASEPDGDDYSCTGKTFTGWVAEANKDYKHASTAPTYATASGSVTTAANYYAVFATASGSGSDKYKVTTSLSAGKTYVMGAVKAEASTTLANNTAIGAITFSTTYSSTSWGQCTSVTPNASGEIAANSVTDAMKWTLESITSGNYAFKKGNNYMYLKASSTGSNTCGLNTSANVYLENATSTCKDAFLMHPQSGTGGNRAMLNGSSGYRIYGTNTAASSSMCPYVRFYEYTPGVTYSNYATTCCQPLVSINGSFNVTSKSESARAFEWANEATVADVAHYELSYKVKGAQGDPTSIANNISNSTSTYTHTADLTAGETYVYYLKAVGANNHCDKTEELEVVIPQITVTGTPIAEMTYAQGDGPSSAESFVVKGKGLTDNLSVEAPANFEVCLTNSATASDWKTSGTAITITKANAESNSGQTVYVRLKAGLLNANSPFGSSNVVVSGGSATSVNVSVSGTVSSSCTAPVVATPTLTSIANGTITVSCASITVDENCDVDEYGFVWKASSDPSITDNKNPIDGDYADNFSKTLTIGGFTTGTTYNIKAYGHNSADNGLSSTLAVTPQSVTFRVNSVAVSTVYVNSGSKVAAPVDPSQTGWDFQEWQSSGVAYDFDAAVTEDLVLDAFFTIQSFNLTWTTDGDALTGDYTGKSGKVNYGTTIVAPNTPTKTGYTFAAWSPAVAATMPDHDLSYTATWTAKQYAITLDREGATTGSESVTMTYNANTHSAITAPSKDGYIFGGWYAEDNGTGAQVMNASGTLQANVEGFTGANGIWTKDAICTLYAKWTPITFTVAFNANGGSGETMSNQNYTYDEPQTLSANTYTAPLHKYFYGWHSVKASADAGTREFTDGQTNVQNLTKTNGATVTLYAVWKDHTYTNYRTLCCNPLAAPANIAVSVTGAATATVTWDAVADATGYEYKLGDGDWTDTEIAGNAASPELSLSGLTGASNYTIYVRTNGNGDNCAEGTPSAGTNFTTYSTVTAAENDPLMGTAKVSLNNSDWSTSVEAADGTTIYLQATPGSLYEFSNWATPASGTISSNQLTGWSGDVTVTANFVAKELTKLDTPTGMGLVGEPTATSATIKWNAVDHASGYEVVCAGATKGDVTVTDGVASCELTILTAGTTYDWTVKALGDGISFEDGDVCAIQNFTTDLKKPTAIEITHEPTLKEYLEGQSFATAGMVVKVTYNNGDIDGAYTGYSIDPSGALTFGMTSVTVTASLNEVSVSTTQAITVHKKYTLTFKNNGSIIETRDLKEGDAYGAFPSAGAACDATSTTFMGWSTVVEFSEKQETAPAEGYASEDDVMGTENVILNAVWAKLKTPEGDPTSITTFAAGDYYLIDKQGSNYYAMSGTGTSKVNGVDVTDYVSYNSTTKQITITDESQMTAAMKYTISGTTSAAKIYNASTKAWVSTQSSNTSFSTSEGSNVVTKHSTDPRFAFSYTTMGTSGNRCILYRSTQSGFLNYAATNMDASGYASGYLWLVAPGTPAVYEDYLTTCCNEWSVTASYGESNTINVGDDALAVTLSDLAYGAATCESSDETVLTVVKNGENAGKITGVKAGSATVTIAWAGIPGSMCAFETTVDVTVNGPITVTYNANDGSQDPETTSQNATSNSAFTLDANSFSRTGYTFQGWATTPSGDKAYNDSQADVEFAEDVTLYAVWSINSHAVTLTQPTGNTITANSSTTPGNVNYGTTVTLTATENETASDGYVFTGWSVTGATVVDANAKSTTFTMPDNAVSVSATYTHYTWDLTGYTVTTAPKIEYYKVEKFSTAGVVIKENYKRSDNDDTKQETYAGAWTAKLNGEAIVDGADLSLEDDGKTLKLYIGEDEIASYTLTVNNIDVDQFVVGIWDIEAPSFQINTYTMPTLADQTAGDAATCKDHNIFIGWTTDPDDPKDANITAGGTEGIVASNTTYYAVWAKMGTITDDVEKNSFVEADKNGATLNAGISYTTAQNGATKGAEIYSALRIYQKSGGGYGGYILFSAASGYTITAIELTTSSGTKFGYGPDKDHLTQGTISNGKVTLTNLSVSAMCIATSSEIGSTSDRLNISAMTVYYETTGAVDYITDCETRYTIEFYADETLDDKVAEKKHKLDAVIEMPDKYIGMSKEYHTFAGWRSAAEYTASIDKVYAVGEEYTVTDDDYIYGEWTPFSQGAVTVDGETLEGSPFYATQSYTLPTPDAISGKKFIGWSDGENIVAPGEYAMPDPAVDITYTAQWFDLLPTPTSASFTDGEWILVTDVNQLYAGDFVVVAAVAYDYALGAQKTNNREIPAVTKSGNTLSYESDVKPLFLQNGYGANQYALYDMSYSGSDTNGAFTGGYLYAASSTANQLKTARDYDKNGSWKITIANGTTTIVAQGDKTHNNLQYAQGTGAAASVFSCYYGDQKAIAIYKWIETIKTEGNVNASDVMPTYNVNLVVQTNTSIDMDVARTVNDFYIEAMEGESGQITNPDNLNINGNAYYDLTLNTSGTMDNSKWYAFAVPFQVDAATGIQRLSNKGVASNAGFNSHYVLLKYNSAAYASAGQGWEYVTRGETLMPGKFYMIALNSNEYNRVRMTKKAGTPVNNKANLTLSTVGTGEHANWNALANNALAYVNVNATGGNASLKVQVYSSATDSYDPLAYDEVTFTVGTPFFVQAVEAGTMSVEIATSNNETVKAPAREAVATGEFKIRLGADTESYYDQLYVSASEEALNEYQIGHDLAKAGVSTTVPQMYVPAYGAKLCDAEFPLVNNEATFPLTFTAPNAGTYQLYISKAATDAELFLTKDGSVIWNLSMGAYALTLEKGTTENYGLLLKAAKTPTGIDDVQSDKVQCTKVVLDDHVYILRGGKMYDVTGKMVK